MGWMWLTDNSLGPLLYFRAQSETYFPTGGSMLALEDRRPRSRLRGFDPVGIAEVVQVARFGSDVLNLLPPRGSRAVAGSGLRRSSRSRVPAALPPGQGRVPVPGAHDRHPAQPPCRGALDALAS